MNSCIPNLVKGLGLVILGVAIGVGGVYLGEKDDSPGGSLMAILLMIGMVALGVRTARRTTSPHSL